MKKVFFKKSFALSLLLLVLLTSAGCGCNHDWVPATCTEPGLCRLCGRVDKSAPAEGHQFEDATCTTPKTCMICGETEGDCIECNAKDPDYIDLNNLGFTTTYGMNEWISVSAFDFYEHRVTVYSKPVCVIFFGNYCQSENIYTSDLKEITEIDSSIFDDPTTITYSVISNDVLQFYNGETWTINKRQISTVDYDDKNMILKTTLRKLRYGYNHTYDNNEAWYVPTDLLDFSTITPGEGEDVGEYYIYFKE